MIFLADFPAPGTRAHCLQHLTQLYRKGWSTGSPETWSHYEARPKSEAPIGRPPETTGKVQVKAWLLRKPPEDRRAWHVRAPRSNALITELVWCLDVLARSGFVVRYSLEQMGTHWPVKYRGRTLHRLEVAPPAGTEGEVLLWARDRALFLAACGRG